VLGAFAATLGDFGQLWCANAARPELQLPVPPASLIWIATLAGALGIPCHGLGYLARAGEACAVAPRRAAAVAGFGMAFGAIGGTVHATTDLLISLPAGEIATGLDPLEGILASGPIVLTLWALGAALLLVAGSCEAALPQPPARRLANPLVLTLLFTGIGVPLPLHLARPRRAGGVEHRAPRVLGGAVAPLERPSPLGVLSAKKAAARENRCQVRG
jgi:hypothetical protein